MLAILKNRYVQLILVAAIGFGSGYFSKPSKVVTKIEEKEVVKFIENKKEDKNIITIVKKITKKDGTIIEVAKTEDKTKVENIKKIDIDKQSKTESITQNTVGLTVGALCLSNFNNLSEREYGLFINKRVFSNISVGVLATDKKSIGLSVGLDF